MFFNRECLVPAQGYYEWQGEERAWQPYFVTIHDEQPIIFSGLWDECMFGDVSLSSCTIIPTESRVQLKQLHTRMPVILSVATAMQWLASGEGKDMLIDQCLTDFKIYKVDKRVNNSRQEDKALIEKI